MLKLRFINIFGLMVICAVISLFYVHLETEIVKTSFLINKHNKKLAFLLDQHRSLVYNLSQLESPNSIEEALCTNEIVLCMPRADNIRRFYGAGRAAGENHAGAKSRDSFFIRLLDRFSTKAEAKVVK